MRIEALEEAPEVERPEVPETQETEISETGAPADIPVPEEPAR
jgi:hypothetical protein